MKAFIFFISLGFLSVYAGNTYSQETKLTLQLENATIRQVFGAIEKTSEFIFVLADNIDKLVDKEVNINVKTETVDAILSRLFRNTELEYRILEKQVVVYRGENKKVELTEPVIQPEADEPAQATITVKGRIMDTYGEPVVGAYILLKGDASKGSITDYDGYYSFEKVPVDGTLVFSFVGYKTVEHPVRGRTTINVTMEDDEKLLSEVVIVGYGSQRKETLTGSIAVIKSESLVQTPTANISNALVGRVPGILSNQSSGEAGDNATTIRIRGVSTLNDSGHEPLIVIDGVQSSIETMNSLDANEIKNISVLKDASSTAVYGVKGANGVIIVTTKRGESGAPRIGMSYRFGVTQLVSKLQMLGSYEYALFRNEAIRNDMEAGNYQYLFTDDELWKFQNNRDYTPAEVEAMSNLTAEQKQALLNSPALYYRSHDYFEEQFGNNSPQHQYNINISGGGDRMQYFASLGYFSQDGNFKNANYGGANVNSAYDRYNIRSNIDIEIMKTLKLSVDFGGQFSTTRGILGGEQDGDVDKAYSRHKAMLVTILANTPFVGPGILDGKLINAYAAYDNPLQSKGAGGFSPMTNLLTRPTLKRRTSNLNTTVRLTHNMDYLTKGLSATGTLSYSDTYTKGIRTQKWVPTYTAVRNPENPAEILFFGGSTSPQSVDDNVYNNKWNRIYLEGKIDYARNFDKHAVTGLILYNAQKTRYPGLAYNVPAGLIGLAGRFTYRYDDRYLFEFNMGYNGSENFPPGKRFGFFPAFSAGWVVTNERFIPKNDILTWLKLRASYGEVGNDQIGSRRFLYLPNTWGTTGDFPGGYYFGNSNGSTRDPFYNGANESSLGNPNVTWERARKTNVGMDINFFEDRLSFVGDYFHEKRDNILWNLGTVPAIVAANLPPSNIGKVTNQGYELQLRWTDRIRDFEYSIGGNVSYAVNKIHYMDEPAYPYEWMNTTGFSLGQYKGFKTSGFYNNWQDASNRPYVSVDGNKVQAGDIRYVDIDGDGVIDANDKVPIGYSNLPRYSFGADIDLAYKGFTVSVLFTGSAKGSMPMTSFYILNPFYMVNGAALEYQYEGRWTPEKVAQGITPTFPRASVRTYDSQNGPLNDLWLRSSQFFRLKNIEIGYNFTNLGVLKNYGLSGIRLFVNGNNLYTWGSKLIDGYDPEQQDSYGASDGYLYPPTRTYNFGVNIQF